MSREWLARYYQKKKQRKDVKKNCKRYQFLSDEEERREDCPEWYKNL